MTLHHVTIPCATFGARGDLLRTYSNGDVFGITAKDNTAQVMHEMREDGARLLMGALLAAFPALATPRLPSPAADYLTPCPTGYDTVVGWLSANRPEVVMALGDAPGCTQRDGFWLMHRSRERGIPEVWVRAPKVLADQGIDKVRAYPADLLVERLG